MVARAVLLALTSKFQILSNNRAYADGKLSKCHIGSVSFMPH